MIHSTLIIGFHPHLHRHINLGHVCVYLHCQCMGWMRQGNPNKNLQCDYCSFRWRYGLSSTNNKILYLMFWPVMLCMQRGWVVSVVCKPCIIQSRWEMCLWRLLYRKEQWFELLLWCERQKIAHVELVSCARRVRCPNWNWSQRICSLPAIQMPIAMLPIPMANANVAFADIKIIRIQ